MDNKHKAVLEYLSQYPELKSYLYFNTNKEQKNHTSINTTTSDYYFKKYFMGGIKHYDLAVVIMKNYDIGTSELNIDEMFDVQKFMLWIDEQNKIKSYPKFENLEILSIENLQNEPTFSGVNESGNIAKYMFQIRIKYLTKE